MAVITIKNLIGKPVVAVDSGDKIGTVSDALVEEGAGRGTLAVVALVLGGGVLAREQVMPFRDVQTIGGDTILAKSNSAVVGAREWRERGVHSMRTSTLNGRSVVSAGGQRLGELSNLFIADDTGALAALEVAASDLGGLRTRRTRIQPMTDVRIGPDAVVVPDNAIRPHDDHEDHAADHTGAADTRRPG